MPERKVVGEASEFVLLFINIFRQYLQEEFRPIPDFERFIDDYVLICFLVGNDFIPRLPSFEIQIGSLDVLLASYRDNFTDYLTNGGYINWPNFEKFVQNLKDHEQQNIENQIFNAKNRKRRPMPVQTERVKPEMNTFFAADSRKHRKRVAHNAAEELPPELDVEELSIEEKKVPITQNSITDKLQSEFAKGMDALKEFYYSERLYMNDYEAELGQLKVEYLKGLQWVMLYYFHGCPDWRWYFPYYYAPFVSDLTNFVPLLELTDERLVFEKREPYTPIQQLMAILPPQSMPILPEVYRGLMFSERLQSFYPQHALIEYDPISEQMNWHSVKTILPFIDHAVLFEEMVTIEFDDTERNKQSQESVYRYDPTQPTCHILGQAGMPDQMIQVSSYKMKYEEGKYFQAVAPEGSSLTIPGYPSLTFIEYETIRPQYFNVNLHGITSKSESFTVVAKNQWDNLETLYESLKNRPVYADYPVQHLSRVTAVSNKYRIIPQATSDQLYRRYGFRNYAEFWQDTSSSLNNMCRTQLAIDLEIENIIHIQTLVRYRRSAYGIWYPEWSTEESFVPEQLMMKNREPGHHNDPPVYHGLDTEFIIGQNIVLLKDDMYGALAEVKGICDDKFSDQGGLQVEVINLPKQVDMKNLVREYNEEFVRSADIARDLNVSRLVVEYITGSLTVPIRMDTDLSHFQFGLNFTHYMGGYQLRGISRWAPYFDHNVTNGWDYSREAEVVIKNYQAMFPRFWSAVEDAIRNKRRSEVVFDMKTLFGYAPHSREEAIKIALWVSQQSTSKQKWFPCESEQLNIEIVNNLRKRINSIKAITPPIHTENRWMKTNPGLVYKETEPYSMLYFKEADFKLGDRVVNLNSQKTSFVPFGAEGTVTAYAYNMVEVLWDDDVISGKSCEMQRQDLLNLTNRVERAALRRSAMQDKRPDFNSKYVPSGNFVPEIKEIKFQAPDKIPMKEENEESKISFNTEGKTVFQRLLDANTTYEFVPTTPEKPKAEEDDNQPSPEFLTIPPIEFSHN